MDEEEVMLMYFCRTGNLYQWMTEDDDTWQPITDIICEIPSPSLLNNRGQLDFGLDIQSRV